MKRTKRLLALPLLLLCLWSFAQQKDRTIEGVIKDEKGAPLAGITITVKGTHQSTVTDEKGGFSVSVTDATTLVITGVGFESQEVRPAHQHSLGIVLLASAKSLSDVVVVGYGTQKKTNVTGAVATVKMDQLLGDRPVTSVGALLQGSTPGLQVGINSGQPGANTTWNIRGGTDFGSSDTSTVSTGAPLILVDNVPFTGPTNLLDPNDIETVTVLKDAGSAAIYGARSAFGVILITTKSGKKNQKAQFSYNDNFVWSTPTNLPQKAHPIQQVQSWLDGGMTAAYNGNQNLTTWMQLLLDYRKNPKNYPTGGTVVNGVYYQLHSTDAIKAMLGNTALQQMHNFSVSGGNDKTTYRLSLGTTNENGIIVPSAGQDNYKRYNVRSLVTTDVTSWMNLQLDAGYYNSTAKAPFYTNAFGDAANTPAVLPLDSIPTVPGLIATSKNEIMATAPKVNNISDYRATGRTILKPVKGLTVTGEYTIDNLTNRGTSYDKKVAGFLNPYGYTAQTIGSDQYQVGNAVTRYQALNVFANYNKTFGDHDITLTGGFNEEQGHFEADTVISSGMLNANLPSISGTTGLIPVTGSDNYIDYATQGVFGRFNYAYQNKYLFQVNGRYDGSSKFPSGHRWGFFPSFSAGWRVMEEDFMQFLKPSLNEFKIRASYGQVGNQSIADYAYYGGMTSYIPNWLYSGAHVASINPPPLVAGNFTWETVETKDLGLDWGILKNRLTGTIDWYQRDTKDILTTNPTPLPALLGTGAPLQNAGALRTRGYEIQVNWKDRIGKVGYYVSANLYDYQSVVTKANNPQNIIQKGGNDVLYTGKKMGEIWGYVTDRFYTVNDFVPGTLNANLRGGTLQPGVPKQNGQAPNPGDILYKDLNKDGVITNGALTLSNPGDLKVIGNSSQRYRYGLTTGVTYANFDLSVVLYGVGKQQRWINNTLTFPNQWLTYGALYTSETNYWTPTNLNAHYGRIYTDNVNSPSQGFNQSAQSRFLMNGAFTRIKNVTLRYNVPGGYTQRLHISRLQVFGSVENLYTFSHFPKGMDPELAVQGSTVGGGLGYPFMRKMSMGLNMTF
jgi:TonB-linked SusC/RagA family outer membrane protein